MSRRVTAGLFIVLLGAVLALVAACGADPTPTPPPTATPTARPAATATPTAVPVSPTALFDNLVARAKADAAKSNKVIGWYEGVDPIIIRGWEDAFAKRFGFSVQVNSTPGHSARDAPVQAVAAYKANKAIADDQSGNPDAILVLADEGGVAKLEYTALVQGLPLLKAMHDATPGLTLKNGEAFTNYCFASSFYAWPFSINTRRVTATEIAAGITYDDLAFNPKWKNRVLTDNRFLGVYFFPLAPGWNEQRQIDYVKGLKANGAKAVAGGSTGLIQALLGGEGDIALASGALEEKAKGAPLDFVIPKDGWIAGGYGMRCVPKLAANGQALAQLWTAWRSTEGQLVQQEITKAPVVAPGIENEFTQLLASKGIRLPKDLVTGNTPEEIALTGKWRQAAIDAFK